MQFTITILGSSSAVPTSERFPTAQLVNCYGRSYLLDCGEGTQIQLRKYKCSFQRIDRIFISHLHGDHFLGLPGLLSTMALLGRKKEIHIHAFKELQHFLEGFNKTGNFGYGFPVIFHEMHENTPEVLFENDHITISSFPVNHSVPCNGILIKEKARPRKLKKDFVAKYQPSIEEMRGIKGGADFTLENGNQIPNLEITEDSPPPRSYAFVTDTMYDERILPYIQDIDTLYHEATFDEQMRNRAKETKHSTAQQAAAIAKLARVKSLYIGHYSVRYNDLSILLNEAKAVFPNTYCSTEGLEIKL